MLKKKTQSQITDNNQVEIAKSSMSVATVFVFVGILFAVLCLGLVFFRYSSLSPIYSYYNKPAVDKEVKSPSAQIDTTSAGQKAEIKITEEQIQTAICMTCDTFPLKKAKLEVRPEGVVLSGKTSTAFWGVGLEITLKPKAESEKLVFEIAEFKAGGVTAPPTITEPLNDKIKNSFSQVSSQTDSIKIEEVHTLIGHILIIGVKK